MKTMTTAETQTVLTLMEQVRAGDWSSACVLSDMLADANGEIAFPRGGAVIVRIRNGRFAVVRPGESITLFGLGSTFSDVRGPVDFYSKTFRIGDAAEFASYNLSYFGPIESITAKTVTINKKSTLGRTARLRLESFDWRNYQFNAAEEAERNSDTMMFL